MGTQEAKEMKRNTTRRSFVTAAGAAGVALAGCSAGPVGDVGGGGDPTTDGQSTSSSDQGTTQSTTQSSSGDAPFSRGELVEDFENVKDSNWGTITGKFTGDPNEAYAGSQSARLENGQKNAVGVFRAFPDGLDLTTHDLSIAVKMKQPQAGKIALEVLAPGRSDHLVSKRYIPQEMDDWVRIDFGYTGKRGDPIMDAVQEIRLIVQTGGAPIKVWVDDLRKIPKPKKGKVIFQFDDSTKDHYDIAFPELKKRGWAGGVAVIPDSINSDGNLTNGNMREMRDQGWDMMSHPQEQKPLPAYSPDKQRQLIKDSKKYLELKGYPKGAQHFVAPFNRVSGETLKIIEEAGHKTAFMYGANPVNAAHTSSPLFISRVNGRDPRGARRIINLAEEFNQMATVTYHYLAGEGESADGTYTTAWKDFQNVLNHVENKDVDVVTPSQLVSNW